MTSSSRGPLSHRTRRRAARALLRLCTSLLVAAAARAQEGVRIGPAIGYEFGVPLTADRSDGIVNRFGAPGSGVSTNHTASFGAHLLFPGLIAPGIDPTIRFSLGLSTGRFISDQFRVGVIFDPLDSTIEIPIVEEFELYSSLSVARFDLPVEFHPPGAWRLGVGPWFSYRLNSGFIETLRIISPDSTRLPDLPREWVAGGGKALASSRFRGGGLLTLGAALPLNDRVTLQPELHARLDAGALANGYGVRSFSIGAGAALLFDPRGSAPTAPPEIPPRQSAGAEPFQAAIDIHSGDSGGVAVVRMERTRHLHAMPMIPEIFFEKGSAEIPPRYTLLAADGAAAFTRNALAQLDPPALYHQTLNILGLRMRGAQGGVLLRGYASADEPAALGRERAERLRAYLVDVWKIEPERIAIDPAPRARGGDQRRSVTIAARDGALLDPVVSEWIVREWHAPEVGLSRSIRGGAGVKSWTIAVRRGAETLARYSSGDNDDAGDLRGTFDVPSEDGASEPIVAELSAIDLEGRVAVARDTLRVIRGGADASAPPVREVLVYSFHGGDGARDLLQRLEGAIHDGARIIVADYPGPRDGEWTGARIAGRLLDALGSARRLGEVRIGGTAADAATIDARLPEARLLGSGARVMVEQEAR